MKAIKYFLFVALAVCAVQAAEIPKSADKLDLRLLVNNGAAIARTLFKAINTGLNESKPNADIILNELAPEAKALIKKVIDEVRNKINEEDKRVTHIFNTLTKALDTLKPIKSCSDKVSPNGKKLALRTEKEIVKIVSNVEAKYEKEIKNLKVGTEKTVKKARDLFDTEVAAVLKCLTPGRKDASDCLQKELDKVQKEITALVMEISVLLDTASDTLSAIASDVVLKLIPLLGNVVKEGQDLLKTLGDCVASLK